MNKNRIVVCYDPFKRVGGFGDNWLCCSYYLKLSEDNPNDVIVVDCNPENTDKISKELEYQWGRNPNKTKNDLQSIKEYFHSTGDFCFSIDEKFSHLPVKNNFISFKGDLVNHCVLPTKKKWKYESNFKNICYQLDGYGHGNLKNPNKVDVNYFFKEFKSLGYNLIDIGHFKPIDFILNSLLKSCFFIGCPSGMTYFSMSVGIPIINITNKLNKDHISSLDQRFKFHKKNIKFFKTLSDFVINFKNNLIKIL